MSQGSKTLGPGIRADEQEHGNRKRQRPGIGGIGKKKKRSRTNESSRARQREYPHNPAPELPRGKMAAGGARVGRIKVPIRQAVKSHGGAAREDHAQQNAGKLDPLKGT